MLEKINLSSVNRQHTPKQKGQGKQNSNQQPAFGGIVDGLISGVQLCEKHPMVNVSVLDLSTAIIPRTIIETYSGSKRTDENGNQKRELNFFAGMEALRREGSGLVINCLIPGFLVMGAAKVLQRPIMGSFGKSKLSNVWANNDTLDKVKEFYSKAEGNSNQEKVKNTLKTMFESIEGVDGNAEKGGLKKFKDIFKGSKEFDESLDKLVNAICAKEYDGKEVKTAYENLVKKTHISENIKFAGEKNFFSNSFESLTKDGSKLLHNLVKENITDAKALDKYFVKAKTLVNAKSLAGLGIIIPLAIAAQPINRWITRKTSGKKGAPIYSDFKDRKEDQELTPKQKADLLKQKFISVGSMIGVAALSMFMDKPGKNLLQFKGIFPSMDQARIISTATFASRMAASEDKNELREATVRDIATFSSFYFLGDYAAKGIATAIEKSNPEARLINRLKEVPKDANIMKKFWNWAKHTSLKSTDELATVKDKNLRTICQIGNLAFSLISLGIFIPLYTRTKTNKKRQEELAKLNASSQTQNGAAANSSSTGGAGKPGDSKTSPNAGEYSNHPSKNNTAFKAFFNS